MSRRWKIIIGFFLIIFTIGTGLSICLTFFAWNKVKTIQTQLDKKDSESNNKPEILPPSNSEETNDSNNSPNNDNESNSVITPSPDINQTPTYPDSNNKPNQTPPSIPPIDTKPPSNIQKPNIDNLIDGSTENKPIVDSNLPTQPPINGDSNSLEMQKSLSKYLNKYDFVKNTTQYEDYFLNINRLIFNEIKIKNNTYQLIHNAILKTNTYNDKSMSLKIKVRYQLNKNNKSIRLWIQWSTKLKDIGFNVIKNYYDKIIITLN